MGQSVLAYLFDDQESFFERVRAVVAQIPPGRVTTYGDIAEHLGRRGAARTVGWALNDAVGSGLPCHRVVNRKGVLTGKRHFETPRVMEERLRSEGVEFVDEDRVNLDKHRWTPKENEAKACSGWIESFQFDLTFSIPVLTLRNRDEKTRSPDGQVYPH